MPRQSFVCLLFCVLSDVYTLPSVFIPAGDYRHLLRDPGGRLTGSGCPLGGVVLGGGESPRAINYSPKGVDKV